MIEFIEKIHFIEGDIEKKIKNKFLLIFRHFEKYKESVCFLQIIADFPAINEEAKKEVNLRLSSKAMIKKKFKKFEIELENFELLENQRRQRFID